MSQLLGSLAQNVQGPKGCAKQLEHEIAWTSCKHGVQGLSLEASLWKLQPGSPHLMQETPVSQTTASGPSMLTSSLHTPSLRKRQDHDARALRHPPPNTVPHIRSFLLKGFPQEGY